eukprot:3691411-Pleurochrysis_carterae.AAC.1
MSLSHTHTISRDPARSCLPVGVCVGVSMHVRRCLCVCVCAGAFMSAQAVSLHKERPHLRVCARSARAEMRACACSPAPLFAQVCG